jgi:hydrogenase-4 membrane subunit HyfE
MSEEEVSTSLIDETKSLWKVIGLGALTGSLCCLPSVIWVLFAGSSAILAADQLSNDLYYSSVRWILYGVAVVMAGVALVIHFRNRGICTLDEAKRERRRIVNTSLAVLTAMFFVYFVWNYLILEVIGIAVGLPWAESAIWL